MKATLLKANLTTGRADADRALYRLDPPLDGHELVIVSAVPHVFGGPPETYIFPGNEDGEVTDWVELEGSFRGAMDHARALAGAGYTVVVEGNGGSEWSGESTFH